MSSKPARHRPAAPPEDVAALRAQVQSLEAELGQLRLEVAQKDSMLREGVQAALLRQGFEQFVQSAEKLQVAYKVLQEKLAALNLELDEKNKELERNLVEREKVRNHLSNIFESQANGVFVTDIAGGITAVNRSGLRLVGQEAEVLLGRNINEVLGAPLLPLQGSGGPDGTGPVEREETLPFSRQAHETLQLRVSTNLMTEEAGARLGYIFNVQDITLLKKLEEDADRRNRFTAMGEMAANIAHEIRNPLGSIELFASLVRKGMGEEEPGVEMMNHISNGIASMNHIISNLLEYTKPRPVSRQNLSAHRLIKEVVAFTRYSAQQNRVDMTEELKARRHAIRGDPELLKQVLHNLIVNAVQAMPEGGTLTLATRQRTLTDPRLLERLAPAGGAPPAKKDVIEIEVRDTGGGLAEEHRRRIFDPFFTTKARGTGLGLAIVHNIIESHHGLIDVDNNAEQGTTFRLLFALNPT